MQILLSNASMFGNKPCRCNSSRAALAAHLTMHLFALFAMLLVWCAAAHAQSVTGQFNGHVYDQNSAIVADANVTLEDTDTHLTRTTKTNGEGLYQFPLVPPGTYTLNVTQTGFQTASSVDGKSTTTS